MHQIKGSKAKRVGASLTKVVMSCFTTSWRFLEKIRSKVFNCQNGLTDRILTLYGQRDSISLDETAQYADNLYQLPIKNLNHLYEQTYIEHHTTDKEDTLRQKKLLLLTPNKISTKMMANSPKTFQRLLTYVYLSLFIGQESCGWGSYY